MTAVLITRPSGTADPVVGALQRLGYRVYAVPTVATQPVELDEAAMIEAAVERGWIDRRGAVLESLTAIVRAGAGTVTYFAADAAAWLREAR